MGLDAILYGMGSDFWSDFWSGWDLAVVGGVFFCLGALLLPLLGFDATFARFASWFSRVLGAGGCVAVLVSAWTRLGMVLSAFVVVTLIYSGL